MAIEYKLRSLTDEKFQDSMGIYAIAYDPQGVIVGISGKMDAVLLDMAVRGVIFEDLMAEVLVRGTKQSSDTLGWANTQYWSRYWALMENLV